MSHPHLAAHFADAARVMTQPRTLEDALETIVEAAQRSVPGFDAVGISTVDSKGNPQTRARTGDLVDVLDAIQYGMDEGPCVDSLKGADVVVASHIGQDPRWPRYAPEAVKRGTRSQLAVRLQLEDGVLGGINFYSNIADEVDPEAESLADLFATHAAIALGHARERENLNQALESRKVIGQAVGIIMERYGLDEDRAFGFLVRTSSTSNLKLRDIAQALVDEANAG